MDYLQNNRNQKNTLMPISRYVELAKKAKLDNEAWVQKALFALMVTENEKLASALAARLNILALVEELDPYPFATPRMDDFNG